MVRCALTVRSSGRSLIARAAYLKREAFMRIVAAAVLVLLSLSAIAKGAHSDLVLDRPSVVVVFTPDADVPASDKRSGDFNEFISDFNYYSRSLASELQGKKNISFIVSSAKKVVFKGTKYSPITRSSLAGYGVIVYVPGKSPVVFDGVATDDDVLCALQKLESRIDLENGCSPN